MAEFEKTKRVARIARPVSTRLVGISGRIFTSNTDDFNQLSDLEYTIETDDYLDPGGLAVLIVTVPYFTVTIAILAVLAFLGTANVEPTAFLGAAIILAFSFTFLVLVDIAATIEDIEVDWTNAPEEVTG